jgi:hypothetical protein
MFERVAEAYEFLVSWHRDDVVKDGPDPRRITLIIRAQSILYRHVGWLKAKQFYASQDYFLHLSNLAISSTSVL